MTIKPLFQQCNQSVTFKEKAALMQPVKLQLNTKSKTHKGFIFYHSLYEILRGRIMHM